MRLIDDFRWQPMTPACLRLNRAVLCVSSCPLVVVCAGSVLAFVWATGDDSPIYSEVPGGRLKLTVSLCLGDAIGVEFALPCHSMRSIHRDKSRLVTSRWFKHC